MVVSGFVCVFYRLLWNSLWVCQCLYVSFLDQSWSLSGCVSVCDYSVTCVDQIKPVKCF